MDDRWAKRAEAIRLAKLRYGWQVDLTTKLLAEAKAEYDAALRSANDLIPRTTKAGLRRSAQG